MYEGATYVLERPMDDHFPIASPFNLNESAIIRGPNAREMIWIHSIVLNILNVFILH